MIAIASVVADAAAAVVAASDRDWECTYLTVEGYIHEKGKQKREEKRSEED